MTDRPPRTSPLFRKQAVDCFVGAFGNGMTPDLIAAPRRRLLRVAQILAIAGVAVWAWAFLGTASNTAPVTGTTFHVSN